MPGYMLKQSGSIYGRGFPGVAGGGDHLAPTCVVSSTSVSPVFAEFSVTITFSEAVIGFAVGDITVGNGAAGTFATVDAQTYTAIITPSVDGGITTVQVLAGACTDVAGNANIASNVLSRTFFGLSTRIQAVSNLVSYKILGESSGAVAIDQAGAALNGTHISVTLAQPGLGGYTSALYDGVNSVTSSYSAALAAAFSGVAGTIIAYAKVSAAGVWTDGAARYVHRLFVNVNNQIRIYKSTTNDRLYANYTAGSTSLDVSTTAFGGNVGWMFLALTWDKNAGASGEVKFYGNAGGAVAQIGTTQTGLGTWAGLPVTNYTVIGAAATTPIASPWSGYLQHMPLYTKALTLAELQAIYGSGV